MLIRALLFLLILVVSAQAQTRQNVVQWPASASAGTSSFTGYRIYRCNPTPCTPTVQVGTTTTNIYFDTGLANSTVYRYKISAYGPGGETAQATTVDITTYGAPATHSVACTGNITAALTSAIGAAADGDIVSIGAGSCTMTFLGQLNNPHITIQGAGIGVTVITCDDKFASLYFTSGNIPDFRLTGFTIQSSTNVGQAILQIWAYEDAAWQGPFRIDHVFWNYPANGAMVYVFGPVWGLIDHNTFTQAFESVILTDPFLLSEYNNQHGGGSDVNQVEGAWLLTQPYQPGAGNYLYIEDNTFTGAAACSTSGGCSATDTGYTGCRNVFRHNLVTNMYLYAHWTRDLVVNSCWGEIYNNTFASTTDIFEVMRLQGGGTGVIHDNTMTGVSSPNNVIILGESRICLPPGYSMGPPCPTGDGLFDTPLNACDGTRAWDGNAGDAAAPGWPCLIQTGRAAGQSIANLRAGARLPSFPLRLWNNGPQTSCSTGTGSPTCNNSFSVSVRDGPWFKPTAHTVSGGGYGQGDIDYCIGTSQAAVTTCGNHTLAYTPYTYPHPLNQ